MRLWMSLQKSQPFLGLLWIWFQATICNSLNLGYCTLLFHMVLQIIIRNNYCNHFSIFLNQKMHKHYDNFA